jgi:hypothetical protein
LFWDCSDVLSRSLVSGAVSCGIAEVDGLRGHDAWGFWLMASFCGIGGLGTIFAAVWFGLRILGVEF